MKLKFWQREKTKKEILNASFQKLAKEEREAQGKTEVVKTPFWQRLWQDKTRLAYLTGGIVALGLVVPLYQLYLIDRANPLVVVGLIGSVVGGIFLLYRGVRATRQEEAVIVDAGKPTGPVNSLNIYARKDEDTGQILPQKIAFEWVDTPIGQPWQCIDDGKWYHLNIWDIVVGKLKPLILPDSQYFDPREFANVIEMPAHKKLFERRQTLFQKIAPWIMLAGFITSGFFLLVTTPK